MKDPTYFEDRFRCFATMWAFSMLFQLVALESVVRGLRLGTASGFAELVLVFAAGAVIWRPNLLTLSMMALVQITDALILLPYIPNHRLLSCFVNITFLVALLVSRRNARTDTSLTEVTFQRFAQAARVETLLVYFFATFAKLNTGFLDPATSCGSTFYSRMASNFPLFPSAPWAAHGAIHATLLCEAGIPLLLLSRRTRLLGIVTGLIFHFALSVDYVQHTMDFSSLMYALLFLFMPSAFPRRIRDVFCGERNCSREIRWARLLVLGSWTIVLTSGLLLTDAGSKVFFLSRHVVWYSYALCIIALFLVIVWREHRYSLAEAASYFHLHGIALKACALLVLLNGTGPFVGFKTRSSFDMYSNLRMEGPSPNHVILPRSVDLFGLQSDRVQVLESNDRRLQSTKERGVEIIYFEFARYVSEKPGVRGRFLRNGQEFSITSEGERAAVTPPPWIARKFLWFRDVDLHPIARCDW